MAVGPFASAQGRLRAVGGACGKVCGFGLGPTFANLANVGHPPRYGLSARFGGILHPEVWAIRLSYERSVLHGFPASKSRFLATLGMTRLVEGRFGTT